MSRFLAGLCVLGAVALGFGACDRLPGHQVPPVPSVTVPTMDPGRWDPVVYCQTVEAEHLADEQWCRDHGY